MMINRRLRMCFRSGSKSNANASSAEPIACDGVLASSIANPRTFVERKLVAQVIVRSSDA